MDEVQSKIFRTVHSGKEKAFAQRRSFPAGSRELLPNAEAFPPEAGNFRPAPNLSRRKQGAFAQRRNLAAGSRELSAGAEIHCQDVWMESAAENGKFLISYKPPKIFKMLQRIKMSHLRNNEFLGFHKDLLTIVTQNNLELLNIVEVATAYSGKIAQLEVLYKTNPFNPITDEIMDLDRQRDTIFIGIVSLLAGYANHFSIEMSVAAHLLQRDLEKYGSNLIKRNYNAETIDLQNIINDWVNKPELQKAVAALGLLDWITELERINLLFNSKYIARTVSYAAQPDETATDKRREVTATYDLLCNYLNSYAFLNDTVVYRTTISQINELIDQYNVVLRSRRAKAVGR